MKRWDPAQHRLAKRVFCRPARILLAGWIWERQGEAFFQSVSPRRQTGERLLELRAVLDLARRVVGDETARLWLHAPVPDLGCEKPLDLIADGEWRKVVDALLAFAEGVTA